jgi:hypothetical protein
MAVRKLCGHIVPYTWTFIKNNRFRRWDILKVSVDSNAVVHIIQVAAPEA